MDMIVIMADRRSRQKLSWTAAEEMTAGHNSSCGVQPWENLDAILYREQQAQHLQKLRGVVSTHGIAHDLWKYVEKKQLDIGQASRHWIIHFPYTRSLRQNA